MPKDLTVKLTISDSLWDNLDAEFPTGKEKKDFVKKLVKHHYKSTLTTSEIQRIKSEKEAEIQAVKDAELQEIEDAYSQIDSDLE